MCVSTAPGVCALGWVKYREHISLLFILCIIVYVTNKAHLSLILLLAKISFLSAAIGAQGRTVQEHSVYACNGGGRMHALKQD